MLLLERGQLTGISCLRHPMPTLYAGNPTTPVPSAPAPSTPVPDTPVPDVPTVPSTTPPTPDFGIEGVSGGAMPARDGQWLW